MSNIYIQEPPSNGKVLLQTSVGDVDIELWSKEAPKACRNFIQLCMEGYYDGTIFHRVIKDFIVQGGDPTGTGHGGESIYGQPFKDETHSRLRFVRRGLVAMANAGPNDNGSQFFFTLGATPELMNKHTIFGKVTGDTVYNMIKLQECEIDQEDRPVYPNKIIKTQILSNPYDDIIPRMLKKKKDEGERKPKSKSRATKNFKLLSFGAEAEEDEEQDTKVSEGWKGKSKSSHDLSNDPKLSKRPALAMTSPTKSDIMSPESLNSEDEREKDERRENVKKKLKKDHAEKDKSSVTEDKSSEKTNLSEKTGNSEKTDIKRKILSPEKTDILEPKLSSKSEELRKEAKQLKKDIRDSKKRSEQMKNPADTTPVEEEEAPPSSSDPLADFKRDRQKYKALRKQQGNKGSNREEITLALLDKFKNKLTSAQTLAGGYSDEEDTKEEEEDATDLSWMHHKLTFEEYNRKVIDANISDLDRYDVHDPRNPLTQRRREASKLAMKGK